MFTRKITDDLSLALVQPSFAKRYAAIANEQRDYLGQWLAWANSDALSEDFFLQFIKQSLIDYAHGKSLVCAIIYQGDVAGNISFNSIDHAVKKVEIGYWLRKDLQGNGIVTQAVQKMMDIAFDELGMTKVEIACAVDNRPSRAVCERLGFALEGVITQNEVVAGRILNHVIYGLHKEK